MASYAGAGSGGKARLAAARAARKMAKKQALTAANYIAPNGLKPGTHTRRGIVQVGRVVSAAY